MITLNGNALTPEEAEALLRQSPDTQVTLTWCSRNPQIMTATGKIIRLDTALSTALFAQNLDPESDIEARITTVVAGQQSGDRRGRLVV